MKFKSRKDPFFISIILIVSILITVFSFIEISNLDDEKSQNLISIFIMGITILFLLWSYFGTSYELSKEKGLKYKCGPFRGTISIDRIKEIKVNKNCWVGFKVATARNGLIVKYDKYNEIYISPETNNSFIKKILELNKEIKIVYDS